MPQTLDVVQEGIASSLSSIWEKNVIYCAQAMVSIIKNAINPIL
jgi:hypothetical protein